jgi:protein-L-isoaspartate O-methyltransferase
LIRSQEEIEDRLVDRLHRVLNSKSQSGDAEARGCYGDIGLPSSLFAQLMHAAYRVLLAQGKRSDTAFVDVGCGGGLKVLTASALFDHAVGLEFDTGYASSARRLFKSARAETCEVLRTDALTCEGYGAFDVIYLYRPMEDADAMSALEERILEQAQPGAIVVAPYRGFLERHTAFDCAHIADALFLARATKSEARRLRRRAEFIGTALPLAKPVNAPPSIWDPVLSASHSNGFRLLEDRPRLPA